MTTAKVEPQGFAASLAATVRLAAPVAASRAGLLLLIVVDSMQLGAWDTAALAHYALANAAQTVLMLVGIGLLIGTAVLTAQALGAGEPEAAGGIWRSAQLHALGLGVLLGGLCQFGTPFFLLAGQETALAAGGGAALRWVGLGMPGLLLFVAGTLFLEALNRPYVPLAAMALANLVNLGLNAWAIGGGGGLPPLGAEGAAAATAAARWLAALTVAAAILRLPDRRRLDLDGWRRPDAATGRRLRRLGYPIGAAQGLESAAFSSLTFFAGHLGAAAVAGWLIVINVVAFAFMAAVGIGTATAVRVGHAVGRADLAGVRRAGWTGVAAVLLWMAAVGVLLLAVPERLAALFTADAAVLAVAGPALALATVMLLADGAQGVLMGALRGAGDVWVPMALHLCSFLLVMLPAAWALSLPAGLGVPGLVVGTLAGVTLAALSLGWRFRRVSGRPIRRV